MRILFISNFYPPLRSGGYAQLCQEVAEGLKSRGHTVGVLTSRYNCQQAPTNEQNIFRLLHLEGDLFYYQPLDFFRWWKKHQRENQANLKRIINDFKPDAVMVWGMWALSKAVPALAERLLPGRVIYYMADYWSAEDDMHTAYWRLPARRWYTDLFKQILRTIALDMIASEGKPRLKFEHVLCVSAALHNILIEKGVPLQQGQVVYNGIKVKHFLGNERKGSTNREDNELNLLYAGQLVRHKGVHTAIEALAKLVHEQGLNQVQLTIIGTGHPNYIKFLHTLVNDHHLHSYVTFQSPVSREQMPTILQQFDVLVFPSTYEEPLARMPQEAMASGLVVVGTTTGGTKELLVEKQNGLTFAPEDAQGLAEQIASLVADPDLCYCLAEAGRQTVLKQFTIDKTIREIETYLQNVVANTVYNMPIYEPDAN